ncbi:MAG: four helix bundle protein [Bacteroidota bacterium]
MIEFASRVIDLSEALPKSPAGKHLGGQLLRSGTAPALNYGEARAAESGADYRHKMKVCLKELRESHVCLRIIEKRKWFSEKRLSLLLNENDELISIFVKSIKTSKNKNP